MSTVIETNGSLEPTNDRTSSPIVVTFRSRSNSDVSEKSGKSSTSSHLHQTTTTTTLTAKPFSLLTNSENGHSSPSSDDNYTINQNGVDYSCGLCSIKPKCLQPCANKKMFLAVFCLTSVLQGMFYTYFVSVLTTIEKLYQIQSKTTGLIMSVTEIGQIGGVLFLSYYGGQGNRPKWIACSMIVFALAALLTASPHYLFGDQIRERIIWDVKGHSQSKFSLPKTTTLPSTSPLSTDPSSSSTNSALPLSLLTEHNQLSHPNFELLLMKSKLCSLTKANDSLVNNNNNNTTTNLDQWSPSSSAIESRCKSEEIIQASNRITKSVLTIFFVSLLLIGIGSTTTNTLGIPYIDDNVAPRESPLYFGITIGVKILGPVFGFLLGSVCTNIHVDFPFGEATITNPADPQWIGAWWLGMVFVGICLLTASIFMMSFPRQLPRPDPNSFSHIQQQNSLKDNLEDQEEPMLKISCTSPDSRNNGQSIHNGSIEATNGDHTRSIQSTVSRPNLKDFPTALRRLLRNDILLLRTASSVLHILPIAGLYLFLPKYLESQFQLTASSASAIAGIAGILVMGLGVFVSSIVMRKFKPTPRFVALWIASAALSYSLGMVILMWLGCPVNNFVGSNVERDSQGETSNTCWKECSCSGHFSPICTSEKVTYSSPCAAGCTKVIANASSYLYSECSCLGSDVTATNGYCPLECSNLTWYIVIFAITVLIHSTCEVGSMLLNLRCVEPQDKAMALGLISFAIGLFGNVPCPILYGVVVDSACIFWENNCGKQGACRKYDSFQFRTAFHGLTASIMFIAFLVDVVVWYRAASINFQDEGDDPDNPTCKTIKGNFDDEEEEDNDESKITNSNGFRSSELKPLNSSTVGTDANEAV